MHSASLCLFAGIWWFSYHMEFWQEWDGDLNCLYLQVHGSPCRRNVFSLLYTSLTIKAVSVLGPAGNSYRYGE